MASFINDYRAKIDDKGRLVFPSAFKSSLGECESIRLVVKKDIFEPCLEIYTYEQWEKESESIKSRLNFFNKEHALFWRSYMSDTAIVEPDGKFGRITIPKQLLDSIGADREVVFAGKYFKIELWAKETYESSIVRGDDYKALAEKVLG
ncbi:MAG: hypothetical protein IIY14_04955 [Bacteroidales bacterium]|jgi:MraZ protein|nr:hypothetical protein [Bacteroidales bacterium]MBO7284561.1 hypothetical protein [Bacteroidales bacterium]MBO7323572.1 hypothetical protein [Bacteroidales bacterium]MBQ1280455.1 hypothetical protein [Bacteroidales bacterium]MBQ5748275.1 hypothetical protein [Bacteroidales bacterium]